MSSRALKTHMPLVLFCTRKVLKFFKNDLQICGTTKQSGHTYTDCAQKPHCPIPQLLLTLEVAVLAVATSRFGLVFVTGLSQSKAVPFSHPKPIIPLFRAVVTVMAKWLCIERMVI